MTEYNSTFGINVQILLSALEESIGTTRIALARMRMSEDAETVAAVSEATEAWEVCNRRLAGLLEGREFKRLERAALKCKAVGNKRKEKNKGAPIDERGQIVPFRPKEDK